MKRLLTTCLTLALLSGCATTKSSYFRADLSGLDTLTMSLHSNADDPNAPIVSQRLELTGSGHLMYVWGRSNRVRDNFWKERSGSTWDDLNRAQFVLTQDKTQFYFQSVVNAGAYDKRRMKKRDPKSLDLLLLRIRIGRKTAVTATTDKSLINIFRALAKEAAP